MPPGLSVTAVTNPHTCTYQYKTCQTRTHTADRGTSCTTWAHEQQHTLLASLCQHLLTVVMYMQHHRSLSERCCKVLPTQHCINIAS
jgi:hypothetical protein